MSTIGSFLKYIGSPFSSSQDTSTKNTQSETLVTDNQTDSPQQDHLVESSSNHLSQYLDNKNIKSVLYGFGIAFVVAVVFFVLYAVPGTHGFTVNYLCFVNNNFKNSVLSLLFITWVASSSCFAIRNWYIDHHRAKQAEMAAVWARDGKFGWAEDQAERAELAAKQAEKWAERWMADAPIKVLNQQIINQIQASINKINNYTKKDNQTTSNKHLKQGCPMII